MDNQINNKKKEKKNTNRDRNTLVLEDHNSVAASKLSDRRHWFLFLKPCKNNNRQLITYLIQ